MFSPLLPLYGSGFLFAFRGSSPRMCLYFLFFMNACMKSIRPSAFFFAMGLQYTDRLLCLREIVEKVSVQLCEVLQVKRKDAADHQGILSPEIGLFTRSASCSPGRMDSTPP